MQNADEVGDVFRDMAAEGQDELEGELAGMMEEMREEEVKKEMDLIPNLDGMGSIAAKP